VVIFEVIANWIGIGAMEEVHKRSRLAFWMVIGVFALMWLVFLIWAFGA
jgi:hypothetical protein